MKNKKIIILRIANKRFLKKIKRKYKKLEKRRSTYKKNLAIKNAAHKENLDIRTELHDDFSIENLLHEWASKNIQYLLSCERSDFYLKKLQLISIRNGGIFIVPEYFSIIDNPNESLLFIRKVTASLVLQQFTEIKLDYKNCKKVELGTQVFFDIILKEISDFIEKCNKYPITKSKVMSLSGVNINNYDVKKLLFSVGSAAILANKVIEFKDIVPYKLCIYDSELNNKLMNEAQKEIDTTRLVDYVLDSLKVLNKSLTPEKLDDLCTVIGEILINAEEHSSTKRRYSIGYFQESNDHGKHCGVFKLAILNFGKTIYEKFADPDCPNQIVTSKMRQLSENYTKNGFFNIGTLEEETLWTLYALQEGVTSVANKKRGNGSIRFIESFFNMKGDKKTCDQISRMVIISGKTHIIFDGSYTIKEKEIDGDKFKFMTFNDSGNIEDKPDKKFVKFENNYFPGTMISAEILFNEGDFIHDN